MSKVYTCLRFVHFLGLYMTKVCICLGFVHDYGLYMSRYMSIVCSMFLGSDTVLSLLSSFESDKKNVHMLAIKIPFFIYPEVLT